MRVAKEDHQRYADMLRESERERRAIPPLSADGKLDVDDSYRIQLVNIDWALANGHVISGKKIGLTSPGMQTQLGIHEPDYGHLFAAMECPDGKVPAAQLISPRIEAEIAFILKEDLAGGKVTPDDVLRATDYIVPAFEVVDSRVADWNVTIIDTVADNASSGRYVLGKERFSLAETDLSKAAMKLEKNGEIVAEGTGKEVSGNPVNAVCWLANKLWEYNVLLKKGEVVLSGSFSKAEPASKGDKFTADFGPMGKVYAEFV